MAIPPDLRGVQQLFHDCPEGTGYEITGMSPDHTTVSVENNFGVAAALRLLENRTPAIGQAPQITDQGRQFQ